MAYYTCGSSSCRFTFKRTEKPDVCPDCGKEFVLDATEDGSKEYLKNKHISK